MKYFNANDREKNLILLIISEHLTEWLGKTKSLNKDEIKWIKTGSTFFKKAGKSMISRADEEYKRAALNQAKTAALCMTNEYKNIDGAEYKNTVNLTEDDFFDLAELANQKCRHCKFKKYKACRRYKIFLKLNIPMADSEAEGCPYAY